jgi:copper(I)-binding protein
MKLRFNLLIAIIGLVVLTACSSTGSSLSVKDAWLRPALEGNNAAIYLTLENHTPSDDTLLGASANVARAVEIHESMMMDTSDEMDSMAEGGDDEMEGMGSGDVMQMVPLDELALPSGGEAVFEPGGKHIMLIDVDHDLQVGEAIPVVLHFEQAGDLNFEAHVEER